MTITEAEWTAPRDDCPHPEYWHAPDADSAEEEVSALVAAFVRALQPDVVVETGTAWGQTASEIGNALDVNGHGNLHTIEPDVDRAAYARKLVAHLPVVVWEMASLDWVPPTGERIGFAWFDSLLSLRVPEFHAYRPFMAPGAIVGFHDCGPLHGLRGAVEALANAGDIRPIYLPTPRGVMFAEVLG